MKPRFRVTPYRLGEMAGWHWERPGDTPYWIVWPSFVQMPERRRALAELLRYAGIG